MKTLFAIPLEQCHTMACVLHFTEFGELKYMHHSLGSYSKFQGTFALNSGEHNSKYQICMK